MLLRETQRSLGAGAANANPRAPRLRVRARLEERWATSRTRFVIRSRKFEFRHERAPGRRGPGSKIREIEAEAKAAVLVYETGALLK